MAGDTSKSRKACIRSRSLAEVLAEALADARRGAPGTAPLDAAAAEEAWRDLGMLRRMGVPPTIH